MVYRYLIIPLLLVAGVLPLGIWAGVLLGPNPLQQVSAAFPWPVACSLRGCVSSRSWQRFHNIRAAFALATNQAPPTGAESLTTLVRQHLVEHATTTSPITPADARRYREEILNLTTDEQVQPITSLTLEEYDYFIVEPFLRQEALRELRHAETPVDLYQQLAGEQRIVVLPRKLYWDKAAGRVATK
ncbi:MAG: hypothetical protein WEA04_02690 [Candidatus Andersenbacteria bacterium]